MSWTRAFKSRRPYFLFSLAIYVLGLFIGIGIAFHGEATIHPQHMAFFSTLVHNLEICAVLVIGGLLTFGIINTLFLAYNAAMVGIIIKEVWNKYGAAPLIHGVLPHGLVEITGTVILSTLGYESYRILRAVKADATVDRREVIRVREVLWLLFLGVFLMGIAAFIESTISKA